MRPITKRDRIGTDLDHQHAPILPKMLTDFLQDHVALYAAGSMEQSEREEFEMILEFHTELREFVKTLVETSAAVLLASQTAQPHSRPSTGLKDRITRAISAKPQTQTPEAMAMSGPDGRVQWINPAFSAMCGYSLDELRGKKLGPILQGANTDRAAAERMGQAVKNYRPCNETILNYHKSGTPYWVEVAITPILDDAGQPLWLVARERELAKAVSA